MKGKLSKQLIIIAFVICYIVSNVQIVFAVDPAPGQGTNTQSSNAFDGDMFVAAPGFFTESLATVEQVCADTTAVAEKKFKEDFDETNKVKEESPAQVENKPSKSNDSKASDAVVGVVNSGVGAMVDVDVESGSSKTGLLGINCNEVSGFKSLMMIFTPVNITTTKFLMTIVYPFQIIAQGMAVVLVSVYALLMLFGYGKKVPIVNFAVRTAVIMFLISYLPYFMQDILNLNNVLIHNMGASAFDSGTVNGLGKMGFAAVILPAVLKSVYTVYTFSVGNIWLTLFAVLIIVIEIVKILLQLVAWWLARMFMIFFYVMIGPIFVVMSIIPEFKEYTSKWLKGFLGQTFSQSFMVIGAYLSIAILSNIGSISSDLGISVALLFVFAPYMALKFMKSMIGMSDTVFSGGLGGIKAQEVMQDVGKVGDGARNLATGAATGMAAKKFAGNEIAMAEQVNKLNKAKNIMGAAGLDTGNISAALGQMSGLQEDKKIQDKKDKKAEQEAKPKEDGKAAASKALADTKMNTNNGKNKVSLNEALGDTADGKFVDMATGEELEGSKGGIFEDADELESEQQASEAANEKELDQLNENMSQEFGEDYKGFELSKNDSKEEMESKMDAFKNSYLEKAQNEGKDMAKETAKANAGMTAAAGAISNVADRRQALSAKANNLSAGIQSAKNSAIAAVRNSDASYEAKGHAIGMINAKFGGIEAKMGAITKANADVGVSKLGLSSNSGIRGADGKLDVGKVVGVATQGINSSYANDSSGTKRDNHLTAKAETAFNSMNEVAENKVSAGGEMQSLMQDVGFTEEQSELLTSTVMEYIEENGGSYDETIGEKVFASVYEGLEEGDTPELNELQDNIDKFNELGNSYAETVSNANESISTLEETMATEIGYENTNEVVEALSQDTGTNIGARMGETNPVTLAPKIDQNNNVLKQKAEARRGTES